MKRSLKLYIGVVIAAGAAGLLVSLFTWGHMGIEHPWLVLMFMVGFILPQAIPVYVIHTSEGETLNFEEALIVPALFVLGPLEVLIAFIVGTIVGRLFTRTNFTKTIFNLGMLSLCTNVGVAVFWWLKPDGAFTAMHLLTATGAMVAYVLMNIVLLAGVISIAEDASFFKTFVGDIRLSATSFTVNVAIGLIVAVMAQLAPWAIPLAIFPLVAQHLALGAHLRAKRDRGRVENLLEVSLQAHSAMTVDDVERIVRECSMELFKARTAAIESLPPGKNELGALISEEDGLWLKVGDRIGAEPFGGSDSKVLQTIAALAAAAIEKARLYEETDRQRSALTGLVESTSDGISTLNAEGIVMSWNPALEVILRRPAAEAIGKHVSAVLPFESQSSGRDIYDHLLRIGGDHQLETVDATGLKLWLSISSSPLRDGGCVLVARDETERKRAEDARVFMGALTQSLGEGVLAVGMDGKLDYMNRAAEMMLERHLDDMEGIHIHDLVHGTWSSHERESCPLARLISSGQELQDVDDAFRRKTGETIAVGYTCSPIWREGKVINSVVVFRDMTDRKTLEDELMRKALYDDLTGLPNRALCLDRLKSALERKKRHDADVAVLFVDLDRFKHINDALGHAAGDLLLRECARRMDDCIRPGDTLSRFGGDEFIVLIEDTSKDGHVQVATRILSALAEPIVVQDRSIFCPASIGIALGTSAHAIADDLLHDADVAMYRAKTAGGSRFEVFTETMGTRSTARIDLESQLRLGIENEEFILYYQPVTSIDSIQVTGAEALVRWQHPEKGLLPPGDFIPLAEETGLIIPLGKAVLEMAVRQTKEWITRGIVGKSFWTSVNISAVQFEEADLVNTVSAVLEQGGLDPSRLNLEITESAIMRDVTSSFRLLQAMKEIGVQMAIDDFGTGHSSLASLKRIPADSLKIDRSFVQGLGHSPVDEQIINAVISFAKAVDLRVIAEGVETLQQFKALRTMGVRFVQGYLVGRPQPADAFELNLTGQVTSIMSARAASE